MRSSLSTCLILHQIDVELIIIDFFNAKSECVWVPKSIKE